MILSAPFRFLVLLSIFGICFVIVQYEYIDFALSSSQISEYTPKQQFIKNYLTHDIDGAYDGSHLQELCATKKWRPGLVFSCAKIYGGIGNVRNIMLNCVRFAIEAGADFVVPPIEARGKLDIAQLEGNGNIDFGSMFDRDHFINSLTNDCPQMKLYSSTDGLWDKPSSATVFELVPRNLPGMHRFFSHTIQRPEDFRGSFDQWIKDRLMEHPLIKGPSAEHPVRVDVIFPLLHWRTTADSPGFINNFGKILRFPHSIRILSAKVLWEMKEKHGIKLYAEGLTPDAFMGAHLRTEKDASDAGMSGYKDQSRFLIDRASERNYSLIYVASGNQEDVDKMRQEGWQTRDLHITTKFDLLHREDIRELEQLRFDQQALVDFGILVRSSFFAGTDESSFAFQLAVTRHTVSEVTDHLSPHGIGWEDEYTWLFGIPPGRGYFVVGLWP